MTPNKDWPHAPIHCLGSDGVYIVTGAILYKQRLFSTSEKLTLLESQLLTLAKQYNWQLEAWSVFMNHYHLIARGGPEAASLEIYIKHAHAESARDVNTLDGTEGWQVWFNFWETDIPAFIPGATELCSPERCKAWSANKS